MKQKGSSDVKGSLWNHSDKKVLLWHREAPLFLRVYICMYMCVYISKTLPTTNSAFTFSLGLSSCNKVNGSLLLQRQILEKHIKANFNVKQELRAISTTALSYFKDEEYNVFLCKDFLRSAELHSYF